MKKIISTFVLLLVINKIFAQEIKFDLGYKYVYAQQWDKAIQTYNETRPWLSNLQPLLTNSYEVGFSYLFRSKKSLNNGIHAAYNYTNSNAENMNFNNTIFLHNVKLGYTLQFSNKESKKGFYTDINFLASGMLMQRKVNDEIFEYDDASAKAFGIGADINTVVGYKIAFSENCLLSPLVSVGVSPYLFSPNTEAIINQTKGLTSNNWTNILHAKAGIAIHFIK